MEVVDLVDAPHAVRDDLHDVISPFLPVDHEDEHGRHGELRGGRSDDPEVVDVAQEGQTGEEDVEE